MLDSLTLSFIVQMRNFYDVACRSSYGLAAAARKNIVTSESENSYSSKLKFILIGVHVANQFQVYDLYETKTWQDTGNEQPPDTRIAAAILV